MNNSNNKILKLTIYHPRITFNHVGHLIIIFLAKQWTHLQVARVPFTRLIVQILPCFFQPWSSKRTGESCPHYKNEV